MESLVKTVSEKIFREDGTLAEGMSEQHPAKLKPNSSSATDLRQSPKQLNHPTPDTRTERTLEDPRSLALSELRESKSVRGHEDATQQGSPSSSHLTLDGFLVLAAGGSRFPPEIVRVDLTDLDISDVIEGDLDFFHNLRSLDVSENSGLCISRFVRLQGLADLTACFNGLTKLQLPAQAAPLVWPGLTSLDLSFNRLDGECLVALQGLQRLQRLTLSHNQITYIPETLTGFHFLEEIDLGKNGLSVFESFYPLAFFPQLKKLKLSGCRIRSMPSSSPLVLSLLEEKRSTKEGGQSPQPPLILFPRLRTLDLTSNLIAAEADLSLLILFPSLRRLHLGQNAMNNSLPALPVHLHVTTRGNSSSLRPESMLSGEQPEERGTDASASLSDSSEDAQSCTETVEHRVSLVLGDSRPGRVMPEALGLKRVNSVASANVTGQREDGKGTSSNLRLSTQKQKGPSTDLKKDMEAELNGVSLSPGNSPRDPKAKAIRALVLRSRKKALQVEQEARRHAAVRRAAAGFLRVPRQRPSSGLAGAGMTGGIQSRQAKLLALANHIQASCILDAQAQGATHRGDGSGGSANFSVVVREGDGEDEGGEGRGGHSSLGRDSHGGQLAIIEPDASGPVEMDEEELNEEIERRRLRLESLSVPRKQRNHKPCPETFLRPIPFHLTSAAGTLFRHLPQFQPPSDHTPSLVTSAPSASTSPHTRPKGGKSSPQHMSSRSKSRMLTQNGSIRGSRSGVSRREGASSAEFFSSSHVSRSRSRSRLSPSHSPSRAYGRDASRERLGKEEEDGDAGAPPSQSLALPSPYSLVASRPSGDQVDAIYDMPLPDPDPYEKFTHSGTDGEGGAAEIFSPEVQKVMRAPREAAARQLAVDASRPIARLYHEIRAAELSKESSKGDGEEKEQKGLNTGALSSLMRDLNSSVGGQSVMEFEDSDNENETATPQGGESVLGDLMGPSSGLARSSKHGPTEQVRDAMKRCRPPPRLKDQQKKFYDPMMESLLNQGQQIRKPHPPPTVACHAAASAIESFGHVQPEHPQGNERSRSSIYEAHSLRQFTTSPSRAPVPGHSFSHYTGAPGLPAPPCRYPSPTPDAAPFEPTHPASLAVALFQAYSHAPEEAEAARIILPPLMRPDGRSSPEKRAAAAAARHKGGGIEMLRPQSRQGQSGEPSDVKGAVRILRDMMTDPLKYVYSTSQPL